MKIPMKFIQDNVVRRPSGYLSDMLSNGIVEDGYLIIADDVYRQLCQKYRPEPPPLYELLSNFTKAMASWIAAGFPVATEDQYKSRMAHCLKPCEFWSGSRCLRCGCWDLKQWIVTEHCPIGLW